MGATQAPRRRVGKRRLDRRWKVGSVGPAMPAKVFSYVVMGVDGYRLEIEADTYAAETGGITVVGLPDAAVREAKERVLAAVKNNLFPMPLSGLRYTINLAPADLPKSGSGLDLPIALGMLAALGRIPPEKLSKVAVVGELALDGTLRPVNGALCMARAAKRDGIKALLLPEENADQAALVGGDLQILPIKEIKEAYEYLNAKKEIPPHRVNPEEMFRTAQSVGGDDLIDVVGQRGAKRALEVIAAGGHNALLIGPPGSGKTLLLRRLPTILPRMTMNEALDVTTVHSVRGVMPSRAALVAQRPFCSPHHTMSAPALVGGGVIPQPGQVSLAHHGVLFLDELPEFPRGVLESMRQPLEDGHVTISRSQRTIRFPAQFILVAAMNPCPCGYLGHPTRACVCSPESVARYRSRLSGPLLDRIDLHVEVPPVELSALAARHDAKADRGEDSAAVRERVETARQRQLKRFADMPGVFCNARLTPKAMRELVPIRPEAIQRLEKASAKLGLSARAHDRLIRVALTIADLAGEDTIGPPHISEALDFRFLDREPSRA